MKNLPQSFEPVGSDSILEQFIQLKNFVNDALSMIEDNVNEILDSNDFVQTKVQNLTNEQKAQARENIGAGASSINVVDNLDSTSGIDALSANQGHVLQGLFAQLNTKVEENTDTIAEHTSNISSLNQQSARALKTPIISPATTELVGIDDNNSQINLTLGDLKIENGVLKTNLKSETIVLNTTRNEQNDTVVEYYVSSDGNTWYRKWASGWKECGIRVKGSGLINATLPISFSNTNYSCSGILNNVDSGNIFIVNMKITSINTITFSHRYINTNNNTWGTASGEYASYVFKGF